jgi:hypothetical protein
MGYCKQEELTQIAGITGLLIAQGLKKVRKETFLV